MPQLNKPDIEKLISQLGKILALLEDGDRHCYHMGIIKLRLQIHLLMQIEKAE